MKGEREGSETWLEVDGVVGLASTTFGAAGGHFASDYDHYDLDWLIIKIHHEC